MDYEKKYNEALERASKLRVQNPFDTVSQMMEHVFPELADSEDERIRKGLIEYFKNFRLGTFAYLEPKKIIAWLERQKEFVSADFDDVLETADCNELTVPLEKYSKDAIKEMCHAWYDKGTELERRSWLEKQGEHSVSPLFTFDDVFTIQCAMAYAKFQDRELNVALKKLHDKVYDAYHDSKNHHIESQDGLKGEQKPAEWGDKDDLRYCIDYVRPQHPTHDNGSVNIRHYRIPSFVGDKGAESILSVILSFGAKIVALYRGNVREGKLDEWNTPFIVDKEDWYTEEWLKSLKDRVGCEVNCTTTWKPSDEQMEALRKASKNEYLTAEQYDILVSLYDDLKKLREE